MYYIFIFNWEIVEATVKLSIHFRIQADSEFDVFSIEGLPISIQNQNNILYLDK